MLWKWSEKGRYCLPSLCSFCSSSLFPIHPFVCFILFPPLSTYCFQWPNPGVISLYLSCFLSQQQHLVQCLWHFDVFSLLLPHGKPPLDCGTMLICPQVPFPSLSAFTAAPSPSAFWTLGNWVLFRYTVHVSTYLYPKLEILSVFWPCSDLNQETYTFCWALTWMSKLRQKCKICIYITQVWYVPQFPTETCFCIFIVSVDESKFNSTIHFEI